MEKFTVALDGKRAMRNTTGLGNYSRYLIDAMSSNFPEVRWLVCAASSPNSVLQPYVDRNNVEIIGPDTSTMRAIPTLWRTAGVCRTAAKAGAELYHGLSNEIPVLTNGLATVVTIHDVIWRRFPADYQRIDRMLYDRKYSSSARRANRVIAISECTKRDIINDFGVDPSKIDVIYQGYDPIFHPAEKEDVERVRHKYGLPEKYMICVGTVQGRKNQLLAVRALRRTPGSLKLVIVGRRTSYARQKIDRYLSDHGMADRVIWLEYVPFTDLPALYTGAEVSLYTSRYEGFGLPVIESIACDTPVISCTGSCLEEAGGKGAVYVQPDDADACAEAVQSIIDDDYRRTKLIEFGHRHIKNFNMTNFAKKTMTSYRMALVNKAL